MLLLDTNVWTVISERTSPLPMSFSFYVKKVKIFREIFGNLWNEISIFEITFSKFYYSFGLTSLGVSS